MLLSPIGESGIGFMIQQNKHDIHIGRIASITERKVTSNKAYNSAAVDSLQEDLHKLEKSITGWLQSKVDSVMATVQTGVYEKTLTAIEGLVFPWVKLALKSVNASSRRDVDSVLPDPNRRECSGNNEGFQMTA